MILRFHLLDSRHLRQYTGYKHSIIKKQQTCTEFSVSRLQTSNFDNHIINAEKSTPSIMKCRVIRMRIAGVTVPKAALQIQGEARGDLRIIDTGESGFNRIIKLAQLVRGMPGGESIETLYEPHILWMNEDRFVLTGFERQNRDGQVVDYAQSWLCKIGIE
jgi:hypothetical protein